MLNTLNLGMARQFLSAMNEFSRDDTVQAIVLRGEGKVFSAGGDVREMLDDVRRGEDGAACFRAPLASFGEMVLTVRNSPKPVLAAVHGAVVGVAFKLALSCDLILAAASTRFTQAFVRLAYRLILAVPGFCGDRSVTRVHRNSRAVLQKR